MFQNIFYSYESLCLTFDFQLLEPVTLKKHSMKKLYILFFWILGISTWAAHSDVPLQPQHESGQYGGCRGVRGLAPA